MKRVFLFIAVNFLVILTISLILNLLHIQPYLRAHGLDYSSLLAFCAIWGMGGAFISLALSRIMAKWLMGVQVINPQTAEGAERQLLTLVATLSKRAGLPCTPEVGIYQSQELNAFATGPTQSRSLVAVSSGLLHSMNSAQLEGVLGHEIAHISNGDMVTMTLLQGVINAFVMFFARILAYVVSNLGKKEGERSSPFFYTMLVFVFEIVFMLLGSIVIATYSRFREFRADSGGARLAGRDKMISALHALEHTVRDPKAEQSAFQAFKINNPQGIMRFFASHPPIEERIHRLETEG